MSRRSRQLALAVGGVAAALALTVASSTTATGAPTGTSATSTASAAGTAGAASTATGCGRWMDARQSPDARASELVAAMTLDQKIAEVHQYISDAAGSYGSAGYVPGIASLCLPPLLLSDAGSGLADENTNVTSYPAAISLAAAWSPAAAHTVGRSLGGEAFTKGVNVLLAPDVNIARTPLNGRTSEAMGEDPYLAGQLGAAYIRGVQSRHVIATVKHYDANNQEDNRSTIDERISPRTLAEIYQPAFEAAVRQGHAGAAMCSYNKVNGAYACQNYPLLRRDLESRMGFRGFVMSDWGATHSTVASARNGLDMEMDVAQKPDQTGTTGGNNGAYENYYGAPLKTAVQAGRVKLSVLDGMVHRILRSMFAIGLFDHPAPAEPTAYSANVDTAANQQVALHAAEQGAVLLKNAAVGATATLPLTGTGKKIVVFGTDAAAGAENVAQAGGSVHVVQPNVVTPLQAIEQRAQQAGDTVVYDDGSDVQSAAALAAGADVAIVVAGYGESEGTDRTNLNLDNQVCELTCAALPSNYDALIAAVAKANPHTVAVLDTGGPAAMPWLSAVPSVLEMWYPGEEDGTATAALLFGDVNPSGKLPITFPRSLQQLPTRTARQYPGVDGTAYYSEGLLVGYRWYDAKGLSPLFPFGYGLSYTHFRLSHLSVRPRGRREVVTYVLTNTGRRAGADVTQIYVRFPQAAHEPPQQLKGFRKVTLQPGASRTVTVTLPASAFTHFANGRWVTTAGTYGIRVGDSSRDLPLRATIRR